MRKMHCNNTIKQAVTLAITIISLGLQGNVYALGLSDVEVQSYLGQPLKAKMNVYGAEEIKDAACFKMGPNSSLSNVNFKLGAIKGNQATLTLTTSQVINEPIVNLSVMSHCGSQFLRDYVVLLDPLLTTEIDPASIKEANVIDVVEIKTVEPTLVNNTQLVKPTKSRKNNNAATKKKRSYKKINKNKVLNTAKAVRKANKSTNNTPAKTTTISKPRLSISGGTTSVLGANTIALRLDRQLTFTPDPNALPLDETAIQDEVTAMNNRLAHLAQQVTKLQKENVKLISENKLKTNQLSQIEPLKTKLLSIFSMLSIGILLIGGYFSVNWLRRRKNQMLISNSDTTWVNLNGDKKNTSTNEFSKLVEEDIFAKDKTDKNLSTTDGNLSSEENIFEIASLDDENIVLEEDPELSVLDHADVFLTHGRSSLAIQLLQNHLLDHPKQSITIWLFLLDLLAKDNLKSLYEQTKTDCQQYFNVKIRNFGAAEANTCESEEFIDNSLESFPRIVNGLQKTWGKPESITFLDDLIYNNRLEPRIGFEKNMVEELLLLKTVAEENYNSAEIIQLDEKKVALKEQKEAQLAAEKAGGVEKMNKLAMKDQEKIHMKKDQAEEELFEFELVERN